MGPTRKDCLKSGTVVIRWRGSVPTAHRIIANAAMIICKRMENWKLDLKHITNQENLHTSAWNLRASTPREKIIFSISLYKEWQLMVVLLTTAIKHKLFAKNYTSPSRRKIYLKNQNRYHDQADHGNMEFHKGPELCVVLVNVFCN